MQMHLGTWAYSENKTNFPHSILDYFPKYHSAETLYTTQWNIHFFQLWTDHPISKSHSLLLVQTVPDQQRAMPPNHHLLSSLHCNAYAPGLPGHALSQLSDPTIHRSYSGPCPSAVWPVPLTRLENKGVVDRRRQPASLFIIITTRSFDWPH